MKYIKLMVLFLITLFIMDRFFYHLISRVELDFGANKYYFKILKPYVKRKKFDILILGSSRTYEAVHPIHIRAGLRKNAFKEAEHGKNAKYNYYFYKEYKKVAGIPELVIYGMDYFMHHKGYRSDNEVMVRLPQYFDTPVSSDRVKKDSYRSYFYFNLALYSNRSEVAEFVNSLINVIRDSLLPEKKKEAYLKMKYKIAFTQRYKGALTNKKELFDIRPYRLIGVPYHSHPGFEGNYFIKLLNELERDGVKVMLIIIPDHIGTYLTNTQKRAHVNEVRDFARKYKNVFAYNYNRPDLFPIDNNELFLDGGYGNSTSHLSAKGAEFFFYNLLLKDIKELYKRGI